MNTSQAHLSQIGRAKDNLSRLEDLNKVFLERVNKNGDSQRFVEKLAESGGRISTACYGHEVAATGRSVLTQSGEFAVEYIFKAGSGEDSFEVCRFYLQRNGELTEALNNPSKICDFNNQHLAENLLTHIHFCAIKSKLFSPTPE